MGTDGVDSEVTLKTGGAAIDGLTFSTFSFPIPGSNAEQFAKDYEAEYGEAPDGSNAQLGYDVIQVMAAALEEAQSTDVEAVRAVIEGGLTVEGTTGTIEYAGGDRNPKVPVSIVRVEDRQFASVAERSPEDVPAP